MAQQTVFLGTFPDDGTGDTLRDGGDKINDNFDELYPAVALNTAKVTNATHTGDATGSGALVLATVNANVGTFTNASITVNGKGLVTGAASGTLVSKYSGTVNLGAGVVTQKVCTGVTTKPYSIELYDSSDVLITHAVTIELTIVGADYALNIYSAAALNNVDIKILY